MTIVVNHALQQLRQGKLAIGLGLRLARTVDIAQVAKSCGFDWLFIDCEHNSMHVDAAAQISAAALAVGVTPLVRVPGYEHHHASRALDNGAMGVVFPHVDTAEQARRLADFCRYPPAGRRSMGGALQQLGFAALPVGEVARIANEQTMVTVMLESPQAIENCEAIAATPGVDALLIGTNDLCFEMGIPGQFDHARVVDAYTSLVTACRKHGKFPGMGGVYTPELMERYVGMGVRLILGGADLALLMQAASARTSLIRGFER
jgi:2-keto-3-deoxy-L-rhamnonate aldolase RhmA